MLVYQRGSERSFLGFEEAYATNTNVGMVGIFPARYGYILGIFRNPYGRVHQHGTDGNLRTLNPIEALYRLYHVKP